MDRQAIIGELQRRAQSGHPDAQMINEHMQTPEFKALGQTQGMTQNPDINALISKATQPYGVRQNIGDILSILGGGKASSGLDTGELSKLYAQETIKNQFKEKKSDIPGYIAVPDGNGGFQYLPTPQGSKVQIAPSGVTEVGQNKSENQGRFAGTQANFMGNIVGNGNGTQNQTPSQYVVPDMTIGGVHAVNPEVERSLAANKAEASADAGRTALASESLKGIDEVLKTLFPDGTAKSFKRDIAFGSNLPGIDVPALGRITPRAVPFGEKGQQVSRKMGSALAGRQLIQTGVAARPEETARLYDQFAPNAFSNPQSAYDGLNQLRGFYTDYLNRVNRPTTNQPGQIPDQAVHEQNVINNQAQQMSGQPQIVKKGWHTDQSGKKVRIGMTADGQVVPINE